MSGHGPTHGAFLPVSIDGGTHGPSAAMPHPEVQGYQIIDRLGEGGMGTVWRALQLSTRREVALKVMGAAGLGSDRARRRFEREVELSASLDHPGIAKVFDGGLDRGVYYYAMELLDGLPLDQYVRQNHCDRRAILGVMRLVCEAVQHAHQRGIIHRDLKPGNILVTPVGEPKVLDFGLAKAMTGERSAVLSLDGEVAGTPAYMSPEQAAGRFDRMDTRSDVFSLGITLFRLLSGKLPYDASGSVLDVMRRISDLEPARLKTLDPHTDADLDALLGKAMAREPERRYRSAGELAEDLRRYLAGEPLTARPATLSYLLRKKVRRYRVPLAAATGLAAALLAMAAWSYARVIRSRDTAVAAKLDAFRKGDEAAAQRALADLSAAAARRSEHAAKLQLAGALVSQGDALANLNQWDPARLAYRDARRVFTAEGTDLARVDLADWDAARRCPPPLLSFENGDGWREAVAFSADGRLLATGGSDRAVVVRELLTARKVHIFDNRREFNHTAAFAPDGSVLLTGDAGGTIYVWSIAQDKLLHEWKAHSQGVRGLAISPDNSKVLSLGADGQLACWSMAGERIWAVEVPPRSNSATIQFYPDGGRFLCGSNTCPPAVWDVKTGGRLFSLEDVGPGAGIALSPDGRRIFGGDDRSVRVWDATTGRATRVLSQQGFGVAPGGAAVKPDGRTGVTGNTDRVLRTWDLDTGQLLSERGWVAGARRVAFSPDVTQGVAGMGVADTPLWGVDGGTAVRSLAGHSAIVEVVAASNDGLLALSGSADGTVRLWDVPTGRALGIVADGLSHVQGLAFLDGGRRALIASRGGADIWDLLARRKVVSFEGDWSRLDRWAISPDHRFALSDAHGLQLWDVATGKQIPTAGRFAEADPAASVSAIAFCADGHLAVTSVSKGGIVSLWDVQEGRRIRTWKVDALAYSCAISPDGTRVAAGSYFGRTYLWDAAGGSDRGIVRRAADDGAVHSLAFSPDGRLLIACHSNGPVSFRDGTTLDDLRSVTRLRDAHRCALSGDGGALVVGSRDGAVSLWDLGYAARQREWVTRLDAARRTLAKNADDPAALAELARWYAFAQQPRPAVELIERARAGGDGAEALVAARCYWQLGHPADAIREFREALDRGEAPEAYLRLCLRALGD